ncbi:MAG: fused response regulator/phosphatase [Gammaproteobacteria bacterium]|nr:fused response regulator/phosphatase [Gammaproteobacteria bacterium]MCP5435279.1 fused response regulator/phosphatase [Chromatiaceae bacterium]MCW5587098.1 fused response regulator/phosphatase [Chromatiales bacterium]HOP15104.1 fused response regulator/phosphatase [Gammaproteobacteria bacterium]HPQ24336.1 fused response regulator/phosphatase [Gammaproteobacteria bacterium]
MMESIKENSARRTRYRVLAIDDSPEIIDTIRTALGSDFQLIAAVSPGQGLKLAAKHRPDLVLLDVVMPELDGFEVCRRLKADPGTRDIPVIFVTGMGSQGDELEGFSLGAVDFVTKPIEPVILQARVRTQIELASVRRALSEANDHMAIERELIAQIIISMRTDEQFCEDRLSWASHSCDTAGGDVVLSAKRPNGDEHVLIGDFTGHGLSAALGTPLVSHLFYSMTEADRPLDEILPEINNVLVKRLPVHIFMAAAAVCIPGNAENAAVWSFGNPDVLHLGTDGQWTHIASTELPMGIDRRSAPYPSCQQRLAEGEALYLMTDGSIEAVCPSGDMFGLTRVKDALERHTISPQAVIDVVLGQVAHPDEVDDMTIMRIDGGIRHQT